MESEVAVMEVQPAVAGVAGGVARWDNIPEVTIGPMNVTGHHGEGLRAAIYSPMPDGPAIKGGVLVGAPFKVRDPMFCSATPGGIAVMTRHWGPY